MKIVSSESTLIDSYRQMVLIRRFEEAMAELRAEGRIYGAVHPYTGQEAIAVGVCSELSPEDRIVSTHRGHGHLLAKGGNLVRTFAELLGRVDGYCGGRAGSMHIAAVDIGMLGANGIVAAGAPIAAGSAFAATRRGEDTVTVAFFGDGATGQGVLWETLLLSATWSLPVIWVCENNLYAVETSLESALPTTDVHKLVSKEVMPSEQVDGNDLEAVRISARRAIGRAREGNGPSFLEAKTFRTLWHSFRYSVEPDSRPVELRAEWAARDPIERLRSTIIERGLATADKLMGIESEVNREIEAAIVAAEESPFPDRADLANWVYATEERES